MIITHQVVWRRYSTVKNGIPDCLMKIFLNVSMKNFLSLTWLICFLSITAFEQMSDFDLFIIGDFLADMTANRSRYYRIDFSSPGIIMKHLGITPYSLKFVPCLNFR